LLSQFAQDAGMYFAGLQHFDLALKLRPFGGRTWLASGHAVTVAERKLNTEAFKLVIPKEKSS
jgi:hypothetical protein